MQGNGVPPHNLEAEGSALGGMMVAEAAIDPVLADVRLRAEHFYHEKHRAIFGAITALYEKRVPVDSLTVSEELERRGRLAEVGGREYVQTLASTVPSAANAPHYARIVHENALLRRLLNAALEIQASVDGREAQPRELVERAESVLFQVAHEDRAKDFRHVRDVLHEELDKLQHNTDGITGIESGFRDLDALTGGFQPGNLVVLAARPSMGKSALVANVAENAAVRHGRRVALFSLEMSETELAQRFIACRARIPGDRLRKGRVAEKDWPGVLRACADLDQASIWIDDSSDLNLLELRAKVRRLVAHHGLDLVIVDYLQLMRPDDFADSRTEQVGQISRGLKIMARDLSIPIIAVAQLNRAPEQRPSKRPLLSDLRESGCLTGDSLVYLPDSGTHRPIAELVGTNGFKVLALNSETWKLESRAVLRVFLTGHKPVFALTTALGRRVRATANHKFLTIEGWRRLDEIERGTHIALPRTLSGPAPATMNDDELALLGHMIGDGCAVPGHSVQYTTNDLALAKLVASLAARHFEGSVVPRIKQERNWHQVYLASAHRLTHGVRNPVAAWLDALGVFGQRASEKRIPEAVFSQPNTSIAKFLRHLWATDGCVWLGRGRRHFPAIYYASSSEGLARDVQSLLLRLEINAILRRTPQGSKGQDQYHVRVSGAADVRRFLDEIGGLGTAKERHHAAIVDQAKLRRANTNRDVIPRAAWSKMVVPAMQSSGLTTRHMQSKLGIEYCGSALYKSNIGRERASQVAEVVGSNALDGLATSDVYWDSIVSVEPNGESDVYDMTVEGLHNFVADNIVVHNSIEQDADLVMFIYRDEYYNREESEKPGLGDIIIAKHRNGPIGEVELVFLERYPKFADRALEEQPVDLAAGQGADTEFSAL